MADEKKMSLTEALGNRKKIGMPPHSEMGEKKDPQAEEDAKFADLEARVSALEAKIGGAEEAAAPPAGPPMRPMV